MGAGTAIVDLSELTTQIPVNNLWATILTAGGFIVLIVGFVFAWRLVRRLIGGVSKGKLKM